jgi:ATP-dependent exoDNAse (exonuclease V) beta subunit
VEEALDRQVKTVASAGAGTGKTTFAVDKIYRCLARQDMTATQVVCITFTRKAAGELKGRLRHLFLDQFHATGLAYWREQARLIEQASFCTIHALAMRILQEHALEAGLDVGFMVLEERAARDLRRLATEQVLRRRFLQEDGVYAELADRYHWEDRQYQPGLHSALSQAFANWFESGSNLPLLLGSLEHNWAEQPATGSAFAAVFQEVAAEYAGLKAGALDFHDLLHLATRLLRERLDLRRAYQEHVNLVILDEAQDTEPLQLELVSYLAQDPADAAAWPEVRLADKLMVVGDLKQAIYRFRGADHRHFAGLMRQIEAQGGQRIPLQENRRCHPSIVRFVNTLAPQLFAGMLTYRPEQDDLIACRQVAEDGPRVWYLTRHHEPGDNAEVRRIAEGNDLARLILWLTSAEHSPVKVHDRDDQPPRTPRFGDIAILFSSLSQKVSYYTDALSRAQIPSHTDRGTAFFLTAEVRDTLAFLRAVQNADDRLAFAEVLRSPLAGLTDCEWLAILQDPEREKPWSIHRLQELRRIKDRLSLTELLERWWQATGQRSVLAVDAQARQRLANLAKLQQMAREADQRGLTLRAFLDELALAVDQGEEPPAPVVGEGDNVVRLLTAHSSKGLEFRIVLIADCTAQFDRTPPPALVFDRHEGLLGKIWDPGRESLTATAAYDRWSAAEKVRLAEDQRKLLYVAATRARDLLIFSGSYTLGKKGKTPSAACWRKWIETDDQGRPSPALQYLQWVHAERLPAVPAVPDRVLWPRERLPSPPITQLPDIPTQPNGEVTRSESVNNATNAHEPRIPTAAERVWERTTGSPRTAALETRRMTVTELARRWARRLGQKLPVEKRDDPGEPIWEDSPAHLQELGPEEVGIFAHYLLDAWDFAAPPARAELLRRCGNLRCPPNHPLIDELLDHLERFGSSPLVQRLAQVPPGQVRREVPLQLMLERAGRALLIEGVADLVWRERDTWHLLDYKTGSRDHLESYRLQLECYALALERSGRKPLNAMGLYFLAEPVETAWVQMARDGGNSAEVVSLLWELAWEEPG